MIPGSYTEVVSDVVVGGLNGSDSIQRKTYFFYRTFSMARSYMEDNCGDVVSTFLTHSKTNICRNLHLRRC